MAALPFNEPVIVPAAKLPDASRFTIAPAALAFVAPLAASVALATLAELLPPTEVTTVELWSPVTSPARGPLKLREVSAVAAWLSRMSS